MGDAGTAVLKDALKRSLEANEKPLADPEHEQLRQGMHTVLLVMQSQYTNGNGKTLTMRQVVGWGMAAGAFISGIFHGVKQAVGQP